MQNLNLFFNQNSVHPDFAVGGRISNSVNLGFFAFVKYLSLSSLSSLSLSLLSRPLLPSEEGFDRALMLPFGLMLKRLTSRNQTRRKLGYKVNLRKYS